jgi:hypothetical protein
MAARARRIFLKAASSSVSRRGKKIARFPAFKRLLIDWGAVSGYVPGDFMTVKAVIHTAEEGGFWAEVPALPGCVAEGETIGRAKVTRLWTDRARSVYKS